jgi:8-oxo-dGTP pyrophosphatase MutT (NUDIX family)
MRQAHDPAAAAALHVGEDTRMPHIHYGVDVTAEVFVVHAGRVLLRVHDKYGRWMSVGGHVEADEDPTETAVREVREEVGLDVRLHDDLRPDGLDEDGWRELIPPKFMNRHRITDTHDHVSLVYFATAASAEVVAGGDDRSEEWRWFAREELDRPEFDVPLQVRFYARHALDELG